MKRNSLSTIADEMAGYRHDMHRHPQTAYEEEFASNLVAEKLEAWAIPYKRGYGKTGIVARIEGRSTSSGRHIALRADMDALDIHEKSSQPWSSEIPGKMHACGHDGHTAILLGAAKYLSETRRFNGTALLIFQPAEEGYGGARAMMDDGLFTDYPCDEIYGLHNWPWLEIGSVATRPGPLFAASDVLYMKVSGKGGHAAMPHKTIDPVPAICAMVQALQQIISREIDPLDQAVISITNIHSGTGASNIIPSDAELTASIRSFNTDTRAFLEKRIKEIIGSLAAAFRLKVEELTLSRKIDPTVNDPRVTGYALQAAQNVFGKDKCDGNTSLLMVGEDFGAFSQEKPGAYILIGQRDPANENSPHNYGLHSPYYDFNDDILPPAIEYFIEVIEQRMPMEA